MLIPRGRGAPRGPRQLPRGAGRAAPDRVPARPEGKPGSISWRTTARPSPRVAMARRSCAARSAASISSCFASRQDGEPLDLLRGRLGPHRLKHALGLDHGGGVVRRNVHHLGRNWNDWQGTIDVPRAALSGFNWTRYSGGATSVAPREFLHANMSCAVIPDGAYIGHSCQHGPPPHIIEVCIVKSGNPADLPHTRRASVEWSGTGDPDGC